MEYKYTVELMPELESYVMEFYGDLIVLDRAENLTEAQAQAAEIAREWAEG